MPTWTATPLGRLYRVRDERAGQASVDLPLMSVSQYEGVVPRSSLRGDEGRAEDLFNYKICHDGDVVLNRMSAYKGALGVARASGLVSPDYLVMTTTAAVLPDFLAMWLRTPLGISEMTRRLRGIGGADATQVRTPRVNHADLRNIMIEVPSMAGQVAIRSYLDRETAQIDALIGKQERLIETLSARRGAVVEHALIRAGGTSGGLKLGRAYTFHNGDRGASYPSRDDFVEQGVPFINAGHLGGGVVMYDQMNFITDQQFKAMGGAKLRKGDLLVCLRGSLGKFGYFNGSVGALASSLVALRRITPLLEDRYAALLMSSRYTADQVALTQTGSAQPNLSAEQLAQFRYRLPSLDVQRDVVAEVGRVSSRIDTLMSRAGELIALARERRSALITAAVTGQIDVRRSA